MFQRLQSVKYGSLASLSSRHEVFDFAQVEPRQHMGSAELFVSWGHGDSDQINERMVLEDQ
jgi:hypothetical protein